MMIATGVLILLAVVFSLIDARSTHNRWRIGVAVCSLAGGVLLSIWLNNNAGLGLSSIMGLKASESAGKVTESIIMALVIFLACYGMAMFVGGFVSPLKRNGKYNNSILRMAAYCLCALAGAACMGYFLYSAGRIAMGGGKAQGSLIMAAVGAVYLIMGIGGIAQWNGRRKRISREKAAQQNRDTVEK